jgi:HEAT repeat protein
MVEAAGPKTPPRSNANPVPFEEQQPVLMRGRLWKNTAETGWEVSREQEVSCDSSVDSLIKQLARADRTDVRRSAARGLGQLGPTAAPAVSALVNSTVDVDATVREAALSALEAIDPAWPKNVETRKAIPDLVTALRSWSANVAQAAFRMLNLVGPLAVPDLADALSNGEDTTDKIHMMRVLARIGPNAASAVPGLTRALGSQFLQARIAAAETLGNIGPPAATAVPALVAGLADPFAHGRQAMAACLARIGAAAEPAIPALLPLLADRESRVREAAAAALERIGPKTVPALIELAQTRDVQRLKAWIESMIGVSQWHTKPKPDIVVTEPRKILVNLSWAAYDIMEERASLEAAQEAALRVLGRLGSAASAAVPTVTEALADPNPGIKLAAVQALGQIGPSARNVIPGLIQMLVDSDDSVREAAAKALGNIDRNWASYPFAAGSIAILAKQLRSAGESGEIAVRAFAVIGTAAVPVLIDTLGSRDRIARENAARALGQIGVGAKAAIPALTSALQDSHPWVQAEATKALAKIDQHAADR